MRTGNKLYPTRFEVTDIYKTSVCPLAKVMRKELRNRGIKKLKVVYSKEEPIRPYENIENSCKTNCRRRVAQFGRALRSGRRGRKFESCHADLFMNISE